MLLLILAAIAISVTAQTKISGTWEDDFEVDPDGNDGWYISNNIGTNLGNPIIEGSQSRIYHGPFTKISSGATNTIHRFFKCKSNADVSVSFKLAYCETESTDITEVTAGDKTVEYTMRPGKNNDINLDAIGGSSSSFENAIESATQDQPDCNQRSEWYYQVVEDLPLGLFDGGEVWQLAISQTFSGGNEFGAIFDIVVNCDGDGAVDTDTGSDTTPTTTKKESNNDNNNDKYRTNPDLDEVYYDFCNDPPSDKYIVGPTLVSYADAVAYCTDKDHPERDGLAYIPNAWDNARAKTVCLEEDEKEDDGCWIGLRWGGEGYVDHDDIEEDNFANSNPNNKYYFWDKTGKELEWSRWSTPDYPKPYPKSGGGNKECIQISTNNENGRWYNSHCERGEHFPLCNNADYVHEKTAFGTGKEDDPSAVSDKFFAGNVQLFWCDAYAWCESHGSHLASITNEEDNMDAEYVCNTARDLDKDGEGSGTDGKGTGCYFGLTDWAVEGVWEFVDGEQVTDWGFVKADPTEPRYNEEPWRDEFPRTFTVNKVGDGQDDKDFVSITGSGSDHDGRWHNVDYGKEDDTWNIRYPICNNNGNNNFKIDVFPKDYAFNLESNTSKMSNTKLYGFIALLVVMLICGILIAGFVWAKTKKKRGYDVEVKDQDEVDEVDEKDEGDEGDEVQMEMMVNTTQI